MLTGTTHWPNPGVGFGTLGYSHVVEPHNKCEAIGNGQYIK